MKRIGLSWVGLVIAAVGAPGVHAQSMPDDVTEAMVQEGATIFRGAGLCAACHGMDAKGVIGPDLTDGVWLTGEGSYAEIVARVTKGVPAEEIKNSMGAIMPPKGGSAISEAQVEAVAAYVWSLSHL